MSAVNCRSCTVQSSFLHGYPVPGFTADHELRVMISAEEAASGHDRREAIAEQDEAIAEQNTV